MSERVTGDGSSSAENPGAGWLSLAVVDSTNALARRIVALWDRRLPFPGLAVIAGEQTAGRGRAGRVWSSPPGLGVYLSVVRALPAPPPDGLSLLAGAAVCEVLRRNFDLAAGLKWPNDVVVGGRKICGVLVELVGAGGPAPIAVVGLGLNVGQRMGDLPREDATSLLLETGLSPVPQELVNGLVAAIDHELRSAAAPGYAVRRFGEFGVHRHGEFVSCHVGERTVVGLFDGLEPSGALRLRLGDEVRVLHSGELGTGEEEPAC